MIYVLYLGYRKNLHVQIVGLILNNENYFDYYLIDIDRIRLIGLSYNYYLFIELFL